MSSVSFLGHSCVLTGTECEREQAPKHDGATFEKQSLAHEIPEHSSELLRHTQVGYHRHPKSIRGADPRCNLIHRSPGVQIKHASEDGLTALDSKGTIKRTPTEADPYVTSSISNLTQVLLIHCWSFCSGKKYVSRKDLEERRQTQAHTLSFSSLPQSPLLCYQLSGWFALWQDFPLPAPVTGGWRSQQMACSQLI